MKPLIFHPAAEVEFEDAVAYYREVSASAAAAFIRSAKEATDRISLFPRSGAPLESGETRRIRLDRFPYIIYYLELDDAVWVGAFSHASRRPEYWRDRQPPSGPGDPPESEG